MNETGDPRGTLSQWGMFSQLQNSFSRTLSQLIADHHLRTLNDSHPGSVLRSAAFLLSELINQHLPKLFSQSTKTDFRLLHSKIEVRARVSDPDQPATPNPNVTLNVTRKILQKHQRLADGIGTQFREIKSSDGRIVVSLELAGTKRDELKEGDRNQYLIKDYAVGLTGLIRNAIDVVAIECLSISQKNQVSRDEIVRDLTNIFHQETGTAKETFYNLLDRLRKEFKGILDSDLDDTVFQLMLFCPSGKTWGLDDVPGTTSAGFFFYPVFDTEALAPPQEANQSQKLNFQRLAANVVFKAEEKPSQWYDQDKTEHQKCLAFVRNLVERANETVSKNLELGGQPSKPQVIREIGLSLATSCDRINCKALSDHFRAEKLCRVSDWWDTDLTKTFVPAFLQALLKGMETNQREQWLEMPIGTLREVLDEVWSRPNPKIENLVELGGNQLDDADAFCTIDLWANVRTTAGITVREHSNEGMVGSLMSQWVPVRLETQDIQELEFRERKSEEYLLMGLLEIGWGIGGGTCPAAMMPLTAKGQLLGVLYSIKQQSGSEFSPREMAGLEFVAGRLSEILQEARDTFALQRLRPCGNASELDHRANAIADFISAAAIVTNLCKATVRTHKSPTDQVGKVTSLTSQGIGKPWRFRIPPATWGISTKVVETWDIEMEFTEPYDITENYRCEIESLFRFLLHAQGLKARGSAPRDKFDLPELLNSTVWSFDQQLPEGDFSKIVEGTQNIIKDMFFVDRKISKADLSGDSVKKKIAGMCEDDSDSWRYNCNNKYCKLFVEYKDEKAAARSVSECVKCWCKTIEDLRLKMTENSKADYLLFQFRAWLLGVFRADDPIGELGRSNIHLELSKLVGYDHKLKGNN